MLHVFEDVIVRKTRDNYVMVCPLCRKRLWYSNIKNHRRLKHSSVSLREFELLLIDAIKSGRVEPKHVEAVNKGLKSGTQKIAKAKHKSKYGIGKLLQGGKVSPR